MKRRTRPVPLEAALALYTLTVMLMVAISSAARGSMFRDAVGPLDVLVEWIHWNWPAIATATVGYLSIALMALALRRDEATGK